MIRLARATVVAVLAEPTRQFAARKRNQRGRSRCDNRRYPGRDRDGHWNDRGVANTDVRDLDPRWTSRGVVIMLPVPNLEFSPGDMCRMADAVMARSIEHVASLGTQPVLGDVDAREFCRALREPAPATVTGASVCAQFPHARRAD